MSVTPLGVVVLLSERQQGFIPAMFLSDVRLRNPAKRFKENDVVKAVVRTRGPIVVFAAWW